MSYDTRLTNEMVPYWPCSLWRKIRIESHKKPRGCTRGMDHTAIFNARCRTIVPTSRQEIASNNRKHEKTSVRVCTTGLQTDICDLVKNLSFTSIWEGTLQLLYNDAYVLLAIERKTCLFFYKRERFQFNLEPGILVIITRACSILVTITKMHVYWRKQGTILFV